MLEDEDLLENIPEDLVMEGTKKLVAQVLEDQGLLQDTSDDLEADRIMEEWKEQQDQVTNILSVQKIDHFNF